MRHALFWLRLVLLLACAAMPAFHPGVALAFDASRLWLSFALAPAACLIAFYAPSRGQSRGRLASAMAPGSAVAFAFGTFVVNGWSAALFASLAAAAFLAAVTALAFRKRAYGLLRLEALALPWVAWRLSSFSLSSAEMADLSRAPYAAIAVVALALWCVYSVAAVELAYAPEGARRRRRNAALMAATLAVVALFSAALFLMPERVAEIAQRIDSADRRIPPKRGRNDLRGEAAGGKARDAKVVDSADGNWRSKSVRQGGDGSQRMIMVVESPVDTLYLADSYRGSLDPVAGFVADPAYYANALSRAAYLETWENPDVGGDFWRREVPIVVYSAIPDKPTSWLPYRIEPTVLDNANFPLRYHYRATSLVSECSVTGALPPVADLSAERRAELSPYLGLPLPEGELARFRAFAAENVDASLPWPARIEAILESLGSCKYDAAGEDDTTVAALSRFLFDTRLGDCSEFSNTAALLGRIVGVPSRVVTGYAVTKDLQTAAHREGIRRIVERFPPLSASDPDRLFLVTTAHAHSWVEFYVPDAGWVDFESTQYAIPPDAGGDPNSADILIPDFSALGKRPPRVRVPWALIATLALASLAVVVVARWLRRTASLAALAYVARRGDERGAKARWRLFLVALRWRGYRRKGRDETPREYAAAYGELLAAAEAYEASVYHPDEPTRRAAKETLDAETASVLSSRGGLLPLLRAVSGLCDGGLL